MGIFDGSMSSGGSVNSGFSQSQNGSSGFSRTDAAQANVISAQNAAIANALQREWWGTEMDYNSEEAAKTRAFNEIMGNTLYTRSVKNMIEAGINPILAADFGLSAAQVNSGAMASTSSPTSHMAQTFMDQQSAWESSGESHSENSGSSWSNSESGLATALSQMGQFIGSGLEALSSAKFFDMTIGGDNTSKGVANVIKDAIFGEKYSDGTRPKVGGTKTSSEQRLENGTSKGLIDKMIGAWDKSMRIVGNSGGHR